MAEREDELDPNRPADRERFGEAGLGAVESESDPDPFDERGADAYEQEEIFESQAGVADIAAPEPPTSDEATLLEQEQLAGAAAGAIGGVSGDEGFADAERPLAEAGEGESEGFELAEAELIEAASHGSGNHNPLGDRFSDEDARSQGVAEYGEADRERVSEDVGDEN